MSGTDLDIAVSLRVRDRLARLAAEECVGREAELDLLLECLAPDSPPVTHLHGHRGRAGTQDIVWLSRPVHSR